MILCENNLKPMRIAANGQKVHPPAGGGFLSVRASSVEEHIPHAPTQLRTHARTHARTTRTRNKTETDFPIGVSCAE